MKKNLWKKVWHFIWEDDSIWSWLVNIVIAFVLIKFIIYPALGFALQTTHPVVAVVSGSMEHKMTPYGDSYRICQQTMTERQRVSFDKFWETCRSLYIDKGISKDQFSDFPFRNGFNKGDIMVLYSAKNLELGDVIVYQGSSFPIIHRVVEISESGTVRTAGDHNGYVDPSEITEDRIIGKAVLKIPLIGYIKILAVKLLCVFNGNFQFCGI